MMREVALVTGAGGSIGGHLCRKLAEAGHAIAVNDIDRQAAERRVEDLRAEGHVAAAYPVDICDAAAVDGMVAGIESDLGPLAVLINNAGVPGPFALLVDLDDESWRRTMSVHLDGSFFLIRAAARRMIGRRRGRIVSIASVAGCKGAVGSAEYGAAKAGLMNLTMTAAKELGPFGITANAVAPGMVATGINRDLMDKGSRFIGSALEGTPGGELVEPERIAQVVAFLCSDAAAHVNGVTVPIDGGATLQMTTDAYMRASLRKRSPFLTEAGDASPA